MMIKLTTMDRDPKELWLNTTVISSVFQPTENERDMGIGVKVYITGEESSPWLVAESVREVVNLIEGVS